MKNQLTNLTTTKRLLIILLAIIFAFTMAFMPFVIRSYAVVPALAVIVFHTLISILLGVLAAGLSQALLNFSDSVGIAPEDMLIYEQGVFYVNNKAFTGTLDDENAVYAFYSTIADALNRYTASIFWGDDDLILTIQFNGQTGHFQLQDSAKHSIDVDFNTYMILTDLAVTLGFTFNAEWSKNAVVNEVIGKPIDELPSVRPSTSGTGYYVSHRRGYIEFDGVGYQTIMDKRINTDYMRELATPDTSLNFRNATRLVPYFVHNGEFYVSSKIPRNQIPITGSSAAIGMPLIVTPYVPGIEIIYTTHIFNSEVPFLFVEWGRDANFNLGNQRSTILDYKSESQNKVFELSPSVSVFDFPYSKNHHYFESDFRTVWTPVYPIHITTRLYIPQTYMKVSTGELVNWFDVTDSPDINLIVAPVTADGLTIDDVLRTPVDEAQEKDAGVVLVPAPPLEIPQLVDDLINHGLVPKNPDLSIDERGNVTSVDGVSVDEWKNLRDTAIEQGLDLTKDIDLLRDLLNEIERQRELERERERARELERERELEKIEEELDIDIDIDVMRVVDRFPFSLPWDLQYILTIFIEEPKEPVFVFPLKTTMHVGGITTQVDEEFILDLTKFRVGNVDMVRELVRWSMLVIFVVFLIKITPRILK